jgi:hypothetical protein
MPTNVTMATNSYSAPIALHPPTSSKLLRLPIRHQQVIPETLSIVQNMPSDDLKPFLVIASTVTSARLTIDSFLFIATPPIN